MLLFEFGEGDEVEVGLLGGGRGGGDIWDEEEDGGEGSAGTGGGGRWEEVEKSEGLH